MSEPITVRHFALKLAEYLDATYPSNDMIGAGDLAQAIENTVEWIDRLAKEERRLLTKHSEKGNIT